MQPTILCPWDYSGAHGKKIEEAENKRIAAQYKDFSIVAVTPTRSSAVGPSPKWISNMMTLMKPMNQKFVGPIFLAGMEVGQAYNEAIKFIRTNAVVKGFKYMLAYEDDVIPQPDALVELLTVAEETDADVVGALYWSKGMNGFPMIYGDITDPEINFRVVHPDDKPYKWCYGTGMGFTLFKLDQFEKYFPELEDGWFQTTQDWDKNKECVEQATQDLYYMSRLVRRGGTICVAQQSKCGHYDAKEDMLW